MTNVFKCFYIFLHLRYALTKIKLNIVFVFTDCLFVMGVRRVAKGGKNIEYGLILILLIAAVYYDMRTYRIPNAVTGIGCVTGCLYSVVTDGIRGLGWSVTGMLVPVVGLFLLFAVRIVGAGDIKLLAAIGSFVYIDIIWIVRNSFVVAALCGLLICVWRFVTAVYRRIHCVRSLENISADESENESENSVRSDNVMAGMLTRIHLSVPIALGTLIFMLKEMM